MSVSMTEADGATRERRSDEGTEADRVAGIMDPRLPQLKTGLDLEEMRALFENRVLHDSESVRVERCDLLQARYKPGMSCLFSYSLRLRDRRTGAAAQRVFYVRTYENNGSRSRYLKALSQPLVTVAGAAAITHLPEREMVVWAFPNDRKLHGLPALAAPGPLIDAAAKAAWGPGWRIDEAEHDLVHYVAEHTCTLRVRVRVEEVGTGERRSATLYGKTYYNDEGAEAFENMGWLWNSDARRRGRLRVAQPICYQPEARVLWQMGIEGTPLIEHESDHAAFPPLLEKAAGAIAELHQTDLPLVRSRSLADRLESLRESQHRISIAAPALAGSVGRIVGRLVDQAPRETNRPIVPLHGDLHLKNFFVTGSDVALIDLDNLHHGDPLAEIGSFLAGLYYRNLITEHPLAEAQQSTSRFIEAYRRRVEWAVPPRDLAWEIATALILERASRCITRMKPGGFAILPSLIEAAGQFCQNSR